MPIKYSIKQRRRRMRADAECETDIKPCKPLPLLKNPSFDIVYKILHPPFLYIDNKTTKKYAI